MLKRLRNQKGLSLLEVLVAMLILTLGVLGLAPMVAVSIFGNSFSKDVTLANLIAQEQIEKYKNQPIPANLPFTEELIDVADVFHVITRIDDSDTEGSVPEGLYQIHVTISWTDQNNQQRQMEYYTYDFRE